MSSLGSISRKAVGAGVRWGQSPYQILAGTEAKQSPSEDLELLFAPPVFLDLPSALPRNKETYRTNMTRIRGKSLSFHCNKAQLGRQPFTHSDAFFRYFWIDITMTFYDPRDTLFYDANRKPGLQKISLKIPTLLSRNQVSYVFF